MGQDLVSPQDHEGRLRLGVIITAPGESTDENAANFCAYTAGFPRVGTLVPAIGERRISKKRLLAELCSTKRTIVVETARLFGRSTEFRFVGPGQDGFPKNGVILRWLAEAVRERVRAPFGQHERYLILWHSLPPLPPGLALETVQLTILLYSLGRIAENYADFVAILRGGRLDFLKFRAGKVFPEGSYKI